MIQVKSFVFNPFMENTYVLYDDTKECVIVDPGCYEDYERQELTDFIKNNELKVVYLLNTHCHIDHILGNQFVKNTYGVELLAHKDDEATLKAVKAYAPSYGFNNYQESEIDKYIDESEKIKFGNSSLDILFVPGHAPGHIAFVDKETKTIIGGDVLFQGSIGRTDLPGGNFDTLISSIHNKFFAYTDDFTVYSGHGPKTTIGVEKKSNPFCAVAS
ncbi:MBL fold metallo-hydrolase [Fulvivirga sp. RKSG066]|nr:MBL fold metallo-hydrolase [Fulvivirga aurantia]MTI19623.1 MBL fold metallo-hydrolase [Fulvivirga aurantia]